MKAAISTDGGKVSAHFGRCPSFTIVTVEGQQVTARETIANPGHHPGYLPQFLHERGVDCIVAGGMGHRARALFEEKGISMVVGIEGPVEEAAKKLARGQLKGGDNTCVPEAGKGYGLDKTVCDHDHE